MWRGFEPTATWSAHWIADARFREVIGDFLRREEQGVKAYMRDLREHLPFKSADGISPGDDTPR